MKKKNCSRDGTYFRLISVKSSTNMPGNFSLTLTVTPTAARYRQPDIRHVRINAIHTSWQACCTRVRRRPARFSSDQSVHQHLYPEPHRLSAGARVLYNLIFYMRMHATVLGECNAMRVCVYASPIQRVHRNGKRERDAPRDACRHSRRPQVAAPQRHLMGHVRNTCNAHDRRAFGISSPNRFCVNTSPIK